MQLPTTLNTNRSAILRILHDHDLLVWMIWPDCLIKLINSSLSLAVTTFTFQQSDGVVCIAKKVTLTSFDDGVSALEESVASGTKYLVC